MRSFLQSIGLVFVCLLLNPLHAFGWGQEGHAIVAEVAMHYASPSTQEKVLKILKRITPAEAGSWMDDMRSNDYYKFMQHWHYVDIAKDSVYKPGQGDNLIAALNTCFNELKSGKKLSKEKQQEDLLIIFHLLGDMHQPLHTGYPDDRGGNDVQVNFAGNGTNLHHLWDSDLLEDQKITTDTILAFAAQLAPADLAGMRNGNFLYWMNDSRSKLPAVYNFEGHKIGKEYEDQNKVLLETQLLKGGIRLAKVLDVLFSNDARPANQPEGQ